MIHKLCICVARGAASPSLNLIVDVTVTQGEGFGEFLEVVVSYQPEQICLLQTDYSGGYRPCTEESKALSDWEHALVCPVYICLLCRGCREDFHTKQAR